jgi:hypothetical protein
MLTPAPGRLTKAELAREPRHLHVVAWFDGYGQASYGASPMPMPRRLTIDEARSWREGWVEGQRERRCHDAHGFTPCREELHQ